LATGDERHLVGLDFEEVGALMRFIKLINELDSTAKDKDGKSPISLNVGNNGLILEKLSDSTLSVTPKDGPTVGEMLEQMANERRQKEKELLGKPDIEIKKESNDEGK
jgi:hypothetical protein